MLPAVFPAHRGLDVCRRVPAVARADGLSALDIGTLFFLGLVAAALSTFVKLGLGIPGHNILRVVFPMALGLALVPRRGSATIMGLGGTLGAVAFPALGGSHIGLGAATGLTLLGLLLDVALLGARSGWSIYVRLAAAGLAANMVAFAVKLAEHAATGGTALWLPRAAVTYPLLGILAGLISAAVWFRATADARPGSRRE